jgi:hypothetical protein
MHTLEIIGVLIVGVIGGLALITFLKAFTAKMATGKWPHQDPKSKAIFDCLP